MNYPDFCDDEPKPRNKRTSNLNYIADALRINRRTRFYCSATNTYNLTAPQARALARRGYDVVSEDDSCLSV